MVNPSRFYSHSQACKSGCTACRSVFTLREKTEIDTKLIDIKCLTNTLSGQLIKVE